jgi:hypothetical protein
VNITGSSAATATLTVTTAAASSATPPTLQQKAPPGFDLPRAWFWLLAGLLALATLVTLATGRSAGWLFATALLAVGAWGACGGSGGGGGTPNSAPTPIVSLAPASLTFSSPNTGISSAAQTVTLLNVGNAALSITSLGLAGTNSSDFSQTNTCGSSVSAAANCSISVIFTPTAMGARNASICIADNASGSPQTIGLSGAVVAAPAVTLSPSTLSFGQQTLGTVSAQNSLTLTNTGNTELVITGGTIVPANETSFSVYDACNLTPNLAPGATCSIQVTFAPTVAGSQSASVSITDNAPGSPQTATLTGVGVLPPASPGTYSVQLGAVNGADSHYRNVPIYVQ